MVLLYFTGICVCFEQLLLNSITRLNMESLWNKLDQVYSLKQSIIGGKKQMQGLSIISTPIRA